MNISSSTEHQEGHLTLSSTLLCMNLALTGHDSEKSHFELVDMHGT